MLRGLENLSANLRAVRAASSSLVRSVRQPALVCTRERERARRYDRKSRTVHSAQRIKLEVAWATRRHYEIRVIAIGRERTEHNAATKVFLERHCYVRFRDVYLLSVTVDAGMT